MRRRLRQEGREEWQAPKGEGGGGVARTEAHNCAEKPQHVALRNIENKVQTKPERERQTDEREGDGER